MISGKGVWSRLRYESGVHRVQRVPETETQGRIHTSTATVAVLPEAEEVELEIDPKDLQIDTFRSSGAGGQHINKTSSAIRITHLPTGTVVECQDERSQFKNKDKAMRVLRSRLLAQKQRAQDEKISSERRHQVGTGDRSERIRTYNYPQSRVTDHRIGLTLYRLEDVLDGNLDLVLTRFCRVRTRRNCRIRRRARQTGNKEGIVLQTELLKADDAGFCARGRNPARRRPCRHADRDRLRPCGQCARRQRRKENLRGEGAPVR